MVCATRVTRHLQTIGLQCHFQQVNRLIWRYIILGRHRHCTRDRRVDDVIHLDNIAKNQADHFTQGGFLKLEA